MGKECTFPIPTATEKQPKPKKQTAPQPEHGMGTLRRNPSPQRNKNGKPIKQQSTFYAKSSSLERKPMWFYSTCTTMLNHTGKLFR
jgi:hypothetical protein